MEPGDHLEIADLPDHRDWEALDATTATRWRRLRESAVAPRIGLAMPRVLLRLPYGKRTDPIEAFDFAGPRREMGASLLSLNVRAVRKVDGQIAAAIVIILAAYGPRSPPRSRNRRGRMRQDHKDVFFEAAQQAMCWIGLREPNPLADRWIGKAGYIPKGENCKAKTADNPTFHFAGLVVDPTLRPEAFRPDARAAAVDVWTNRFLKAGRLPTGFTCAQTGSERGLVRFCGSAIFADYDLMAINRSSPDGEWLATSGAQQKALFVKVEPLLRRGLHVPMIQHPTEFMWTGGVGAREMEWVLWFGPGRRFYRGPSSMPRAGH